MRPTRSWCESCGCVVVWLTMQGVCALAGVCRRTVYSWAVRGWVHSHVLPNGWRVIRANSILKGPDGRTVVPRAVVASMLSWGPVLAGNPDYPWRPYDPDSATVALYHMNEPTVACIDSSANGLDAQVFGATWTPEGRFSGCLVFDGDDSVRVPNSDATATPNATFEAWVLLSRGVVVPMPIIEKLFPLNPLGRGLAIDADRRVIAYAFDSPARYIARSVTTIQPGEWVHVAAIFNDGTHRVQVSVNGVVEDDQALGCCTATQNMAVTIGRRTRSDDAYFCGKIDEVRISSRARALQSVGIEMKSWTRIRKLWH